MQCYPFILHDLNPDFESQKADSDEDSQLDDVKTDVLKQVVHILIQLFKSTLFLTKVYSTNPINIYMHLYTY